MSQSTSSPQELALLVQAAEQKHQAACDESSHHELMVILNTLGSPALISSFILLMREHLQLSAESANPLLLFGSAIITGLAGLAGLFSAAAIREHLEKSKKAGNQAQQLYKEWLKLSSQTYEAKPRR